MSGTGARLDLLASLTKDSVLIGIITTPRKKGRYPLPVGKDSRLKQEIIAIAKAKGICIIYFYPQGINLNNQTIFGHTYAAQNNQTGHWVKGVFPLPHVIYNRLSFRRDESDKKVQKLLASLEKCPDIHVFNTRFLDKWEVYSILIQNGLTKEMVPETCLFNRNNLSIMLNKYHELFLKPTNKSLGKGVIKLRYESDKRPVYWCRKYQDREWQKYHSIKDLYSFLQKKIRDKTYLIQKGIDLATINGRVFDLRTEVQKNNEGKWVFTGTGVRIAAPGKFVTHVPNGGTKAKYEEVITSVFGHSESIKKHIEQQLTYICQTVPAVLEKGLDINLGILSIDIGINKSGHMEVIEVNSKPSSFDENDIRQRHLENLIDYFQYLISLSYLK